MVGVAMMLESDVIEIYLQFSFLVLESREYAERWNKPNALSHTPL